MALETLAAADDGLSQRDYAKESQGRIAAAGCERYKEMCGASKMSNVHMGTSMRLLVAGANMVAGGFDGRLGGLRARAGYDCSSREYSTQMWRCTKDGMHGLQGALVRIA